MKRRFYFDTSVFGGVFDKEFSEHSIQLFDQVKEGRVICLYSKIVDKELQNAPRHVVSHAKKLPLEYIEYVEESQAMKDLVQLYLQEKIINSNYIDDCKHVALATICKADLLVSWDFKHLVNPRNIKAFNSVNLSLGYSAIKIQSPNQITDYEK